MRSRDTLLLLLLFLIFIPGNIVGKSVVLNKWDIQYPDDSIFNRITDIDERLKIFTEKDTLGGYSAPRKVDASVYLRTRIDRGDSQRNTDGLLIVPFKYDSFDAYTTFRDTIIVDPVMLPVVFNGKILPQNLDFWKEDKISSRTSNIELISRDSIVAPNLFSYNQDKGRYKLIDKNSTQAPNLKKAEQIEKTRKFFFTTEPLLIKSNALAFEGNSPITQKEVESKNPFKELITAGDAITIAAPDVETFKVKQVFWKLGGENNLSVSQKAYSYSWDGSPNDFFSILSYQKFTAQYKKNKITFDHLLEWRLSLQRFTLSSAEKENNPDYNDGFLINDDYIRTYNTLGLQSFLKNWSYTISLEMKTPVFYKKTMTDKHKRTQAPFSPLTVNLGIAGVKYSLNKASTRVKGRSVSLNVNVAPLSISMIHIGSRQVYKNANYGVIYPAGHPKAGEPRYTKTAFGSIIDANLTYNLNSFSSVFTRMQYNTSYEDIKFDSETTINFKLNRYLSTKLYVFMKYDDSKTRHVKWKYFSVNEELGFGLSYAWN